MGVVTGDTEPEPVHLPLGNMAVVCQPVGTFCNFLGYLEIFDYLSLFPSYLINIVHVFIVQCLYNEQRFISAQN